jgi:hypothetical protein
MQHLAIRSDWTLPRDVQLLKETRCPTRTADADVSCTKCGVTYQLWSPELETEKEAIKAQREFLKKRLEQDHPNHISYFLTPDRPE